ncbi:hypothetical protein LSTR_LSTR011950 [Laodelphax striatellus]|uniref:PP1-binding domain-containing protein n=1 Tax=Laodelphax striatellus TaxID=195883 RepID=A0A482WZJ0_LAOST|nr:hypothetical protein LSTR_LSTR011950 [Laodelphax striatellus]
MDGVEGLSRKRKRSEDFSRPAKKSIRRKTISCADGIKRNGDPRISRMNKSLPLMSPKKLDKFLPRTPKSKNANKTPRKGGSLGRGSLKAGTSEVNGSAVNSTRKKLKLSSEESATKLPKPQVKSKIPTSMSLSKVKGQVRLGLSKKPISKINRKPLLKKSVLDRVVKPFSPSKRITPLQNHPLVTKIPTSFKFTSKTKPSTPPRTASPKKEVNKSSTSKTNIGSREQGSSKQNFLSQSSTDFKNKSLVSKTSPKNTSLKENISKTIKKTSPTNVKVNTSKKVSPSKNPSTSKTPAKNTTQSVKKIKPLSFSINKKRKSKNMSMEVKFSSPKKALSLNKSMPAKLSSSKKDQTQSGKTKLSDNNDKSAINTSTLKTPKNQGKMKVEQASIGKSSNRKLGFNTIASGSKGNEVNTEIKKMSYSSAVKRKPINKVLPPLTSKAADSKPVVIPRNIMIQAHKKTAFSNRHVNSPDPIIISHQSLKSLANRSAKKDLRIAMKPNIAKQASKPARERFVPSALKTPKTPSSETFHSKLNISRNKDTEKTPIILKASTSKVKTEASSSNRKTSNGKKNSTPEDLTTPSVVKIHNISVRNDSLLKSSMKQEHGPISCKKVNFDMSHLISKSIQGDKDSSISSDKKEISGKSEEPSKCFLAALELSCDSFLDGTTIINSAAKRTRRSSVRSQHIHASTPIQSARQADWLVNTPSRMLMLHAGHSKSPAPGSSKKLDYSASNDISSSSKSNDASHNLPSCEVYLTPYITAETLNISVENFVSPLTPGALGLNVKNQSTLSSSRTRKSVSKQVSDSLEVFSSTLKGSRQSLNISKTLPSAKAYPTKSPKNDLQDIRGVKEIFKRKSPKNDLRNNISGVKRLLASRQKSPKNDLRDVIGVKRVMKSPQKSPKNDLRDVRGVKRLMSSPQKSPKNDLRDVIGVKRVMQKSPKNDLRDVRGVKRVMSSPQKSPKNDLRHVRGVKRLMKSPQKSPKNDLRDVRGVKRLLSSPQKSPKNDLRDVGGVKRLLSQKDPENDLRNVSGLKQLISTPSNRTNKIEKSSAEQKQSSTEEAASKNTLENVQIKTEGKIQLAKSKAQPPKEVPAKRKVKQETDSSTGEQKVQRRTRTTGKLLLTAESESSDLTKKSNSNSSGRKVTSRKTKNESQEAADAAGITKTRASKRTKKNVPKEIESAVKHSGKKLAGARNSLVKNLRKRKSSGVLVVSAKKVQFNPEVKSVGGKGKRASKNAETSETPVKRKRTAKASTAVSKSNEVKSTNAIAGPSTEKATSAPVKAKRATRTNKADTASSETKPTRGKKSTYPGKSSEVSTAVEKASPVKEKRTRGAKKAAPATVAKTTRGKKVAETVTAKQEKPVVKSSTTSKRKAASNKENVPVPKVATPPSSVPRRVLRNRKC